MNNRIWKCLKSKHKDMNQITSYKVWELKDLSPYSDRYVHTVLSPQYSRLQLNNCSVNLDHQTHFIATVMIRFMQDCICGAAKKH